MLFSLWVSGQVGPQSDRNLRTFLSLGSIKVLRSNDTCPIWSFLCIEAYIHLIILHLYHPKRLSVSVFKRRLNSFGADDHIATNICFPSVTILIHTSKCEYYLNLETYHSEMANILNTLN